MSTAPLGTALCPNPTPFHCRPVDPSQASETYIVFSARGHLSAGGAHTLASIYIYPRYNITYPERLESFSLYSENGDDSAVNREVYYHLPGAASCCGKIMRALR